MTRLRRFVGVWVLAGCLLSCAVAASESGDWELARDREGIQVYTREVAGSKIRAFRGVVEIGEPLLPVLGVLDDAPGFVSWMHHCKESVLLERRSLFDRMQYMAIDFPWPTSDRDVIVHNTVEPDWDAQRVLIRLGAVSAAALTGDGRALLPQLGKYRRVTVMAGFFELQAIEAGRTRVVYQLHMEPAGAVPAGIVNAMIVDNPFHSLVALRERAAMAKYENFDPLHE